MSWPGPTEFALYLGAGAALGAVYFVLLGVTIRLYAARAGAVRIVPLYFARIALAVVAFWIAARHGAAPLLLALLGFQAARAAAQRRMRWE